MTPKYKVAYGANNHFIIDNLDKFLSKHLIYSGYEIQDEVG